MDDDRMVPPHQIAMAAVSKLLYYIGEDPAREGLRDTPKRVVKAYNELFSGYKEDPKSIMTVFEDGACDELVILRDVEMVSMCEHHILPFIGKVHLAYLPDKKIIGVSKLARLVEIFSRRLQVQERLTQQIAHSLQEHLQPKGVACVIEASHLCMVCRGVRKQHSVMVTSALTGSFKEDPATRAEFFRLIKE